MIILAIWIAAIIGHYVVGATLVWILWQWFAVPHGAPVLNVAYIAGIMLLARTLVGPRFPSQSPNQTQLIGQVVGVYLFYLFAFFIGWVIYKVGCMWDACGMMVGCMCDACGMHVG